MTTCVDTLGPGPDNVLCPSDHCDDFQETTAFHRICNCVDWQGNPIPDCSPKDNLYPVQTGECYNPSTNTWQAGTSQACAQMGLPWYFRTCYCCCSCLAANTPVGAPAGFRALGDFVVGDEVLAATRAGQSWSWEAQTVQFSNGSPATTDPGPTTGNITVYVEYGDGKSLVVTPNQLFALVDGNLKRADQLVPGSDSLSDADGNAVAIARVATGYYKGGIHHIATAIVPYDEFDGSIDGHLINANGVVVGDYLLQMYEDTPKLAPHIEHAAPAIGTPAYTETYPDLVVKPYVVGPSHEVTGAEITAADFVAHGESTASIPDDATALFTRRQQAMLLDPDVPKRGFSDTTNVTQVEYFTKLFGAFYPDVQIVLDWENTQPNVFAYTEDGSPRVFIGGELLRLGPLYGPAMAMAIGFGVAAATRAAGGPGRALYDGIYYVLLKVRETDWNETVRAGQTQLDAIFTALAGKEPPAQGPAEGLSAACLSETVDAAVSGDEIPVCATGGLLTVVNATYESGTVTVTFSAAVDRSSAADPDNYSILPEGTASGAEPASKSDTQVDVEVALENTGSHTITVANVSAADGTPLDPNACSASFTVPE